MADWLWNYYCSVYFLLYRFMKWLLRLLTGRCELQRICHRYGPGASSTLRVENSLKTTKDKDLKDLVHNRDLDVDGAVKLITRHKKINPEKDPVFVEHIGVCLTQICGYNELWDEVEQHRKRSFDSNDPNHEEMLLKLWSLLMPNEPLEGRISKQWGEIGFQGKDPQTDFRGMGILGLENLLYFAQNHTAAARRVLTQSHHPVYGYSMAIVGINMTGLLYAILTDGALKVHFYNILLTRPKFEDLHELYCFIFCEFNDFWFREKPESIMDFNQYRDKFEKELRMRLTNPSTVLSLPVDKHKSDQEDCMSISSVGSQETI